MPESSSVPKKIIELAENCIARAHSFAKEDKPDIAVFWASSVNALFALALWMNQDGQVGAKEFQKIAKLGADARSIIRGVGPVGLGAAGAPRMTPEQRCVVDAYHRFLEIYERKGF